MGPVDTRFRGFLARTAVKCFAEFFRHCEHRTLYELPGSSVAAGHRTGKEKQAAFSGGQMWEDVAIRIRSGQTRASSGPGVLFF